MYILGIGDGHDSGAAIIKDNRILVAINEERLTRRKLEIAFPEKSIRTCLEYLNLSPGDISCCAVPTFDFSKTLARFFPSLKEEYYLVRRRKKNPGLLKSLKKLSKYKLTEIGPSSFTENISRAVLKQKLNNLGFYKPDLSLFDHHLCHASAAAFCSGFEECAVITLDGIGDGLSGSVYQLKGNDFELINTISGKASLGIFFEHVTNLLNMRELEDEGKVMALANYACPVNDNENPLLNFFHIDDTDIKARYGSIGMYKELKKILWQYPSEQFAYMAQRTLEIKICELIKNILLKTGYDKIALAGGIFSNIKVNMCVSKLPMVSDYFVFPHMGDGGLALGAAMYANYLQKKVTKYGFNSVFLGLDYKDEDVEKTLIKYKLKFEKKNNIAHDAARLIAGNEIVFWFQGRMEYGPRALGHRSILAPADSDQIKNKLNLELKQRVWYQPFCPSLLEEDASLFLEPGLGKPNRFMTTGYRVKPEKLDQLKGVISIDGACRAQLVDNVDSLFHSLLLELKKITGRGIILNTSFNIHGEPLVCSPEDAVKTFLKTNSRYMAIHDYLVKK